MLTLQEQIEEFVAKYGPRGRREFERFVADLRFVMNEYAASALVHGDIPPGRAIRTENKEGNLMDPLEILNDLADSCDRGEDAAFWILTSAAAHVAGYDLADGHGSSVASALGGGDA